jgi:hypothetical protein
VRLVDISDERLGQVQEAQIDLIEINKSCETLGRYLIFGLEDFKLGNYLLSI